jgi:hypothetical protein
MDQETRERLMIDDALGVLEPDVQVLLGAYLAATGVGEKERQEWRELAAAARKAMPPDVEEEILPPFSAPRVNHWGLWRVTQMAVAAVTLVIFGFGLGHWRGREPERTALVAQTPVTVAAEPIASFGVHDFWSTQRFLAGAMEVKHADRPAWHWNFSTQSPETGEQP